MKPKQILRHLLETAASHVEPPLLNERNIARLAWAGRIAAQWYEAQRQMDARCTEAVDHVSEEEIERLFQSEQAKVKAIRAEITAVIDADHWPPELHFTAI